MPQTKNETLRQAVKEHLEAGTKTMTELAEMFNVTRQRIFQIAKAHGLTAKQQVAKAATATKAAAKTAKAK
jgi:DNA-directed RNA polymerase sigma subunit (sigma70/sigma32)